MRDGYQPRNRQVGQTDRQYGHLTTVLTGTFNALVLNISKLVQ